jgi:hypothetical protein
MDYGDLNMVLCNLQTLQSTTIGTDTSFGISTGFDEEENDFYIWATVSNTKTVSHKFFAATPKFNKLYMAELIVVVAEKKERVMA